MDLSSAIRNIPDFPHEGIQFKDITTLLLEPEAFRHVVDTLVERYREARLDAVVALDARGFIFGGALAYALGLPLAIARKKGKLPAATVEETFDLEYGTATLAMHVDAIQPGQRVVVLDDLLATGGTAAAAARLVRRLGGEVVEAAFVVELPPLKGRETLGDIPVYSMVSFMVE